jgi:hypothetical protein
VTGGLLFTLQKAVTAGRSGDGFSQVTKPHMAHLWPRPKTYFPREKAAAGLRQRRLSETHTG